MTASTSLKLSLYLFESPLRSFQIDLIQVPSCRGDDELPDKLSEVSSEESWANVIADSDSTLISCNSLPQSIPLPYFFPVPPLRFPKIVRNVSNLDPSVFFHKPSYDDLGFICKYGDNNWETSFCYEKKREVTLDQYVHIWEDLLQQDLWVDDGVALKNLILNGVPNRLRHLVWSRCLGSFEAQRQNPDVYQQLYNKQLDSGVIHQISLDLCRTFPQNIHFRGSGESLEKLKRVLFAFAAFKPEINYCQSLNFIAAVFLLIMDEELAFWSLVQLIEPVIVERGMNIPDYYKDRMIGLKRDLKLLDSLLALYVPVVHACLKKHGVELVYTCAEWLLTLFSSVLPINTVLRIWDFITVEGRVGFFRIAVGIFLKNEQAFCRVTSLEDAMVLCKSMMGEMIDHTDLITFTMENLGFISRDVLKEHEEKLGEINY